MTLNEQFGSFQPVADCCYIEYIHASIICLLERGALLNKELKGIQTLVVDRQEDQRLIVLEVRTGEEGIRD